jgi:NADPH:quinone reductase-like Zn-dependent oxidoreductase
MAHAIPTHMAAVQLTGHGGFETLHYREDVPVPTPSAGEVLIRVHAAGINNTDINTRIGWYAADQTMGTNEAVASTAAAPAKGDWSGSGMAFPRIQGADVCGTIVAVGEGVAPSRLDERVIVQGCLRSLTRDGITPWLGSERDGAFAQFVAAPAADTYAVRCDLSDEQLAAVPCGYGTAENLLTRARVAAGERVLITGASGNVGIAAMQLAKLRAAEAIAVAASEKFEAMRALGAEICLKREQSPLDALGPNSVDVAIDVVGGPSWPELLQVLKPKGRYATSGAIAGPIVPLDLRLLYAKDLTFYGCTAQEPEVMPNLVRHLERGALVPLVSNSFALKDIVAAQKEFLSKRQLGKIVLIPPGRAG